MSNIDKLALRKKLNRRLNDAFGFQRTSGGKHTTISLSIDECKSVLVVLDELEVVNELFLRAKALMYQSGGTPIENSLNPIDAWLYDAERAAAAGKGE